MFTIVDAMGPNIVALTPAAELAALREELSTAIKG